jgi:hypothetical protein
VLASAKAAEQLGNRMPGSAESTGATLPIILGLMEVKPLSSIVDNLFESKNAIGRSMY